MNNSKSKINIYQNKPFSKKKKSYNSKNITYNKPLFINMSINNDIKSNTYNFISKNSSCSTKICSTNSESPFRNKLGKNTSRDYSVKEFEIDKNGLKTTSNFFSKYINTSISYSDDYNNDYETFTPSRKNDSPFNDNDKEQFTPYLGQKKTNGKNNKDNKKGSINNNKNNNQENNKYSIIFNNSRTKIESASLNLRNHFDEQLSNKYKIINKYQKLYFYQKKNGLNNFQNKSRNKNNRINTNYSSFSKFNDNSKLNNQHFLYKKKTDLSLQREYERKILEWFYIHNIDISLRELYEKYVILIQTIFRGYISRVKLYNKLKIYTCITVLCQILNNIYLEKNKNFMKSYFKRIIKYDKNVNNKLKISKNSFIIERKENRNSILCKKIKELIEQNNNLQIKLNQFLINNNNLKNEISNYKEYENKYNKLLTQLEKIQKANNYLIKDNNQLIKELNKIKNNQKKDNLIKLQNVINFNLLASKNNILKNLKISNNINVSIINSINKKVNNNFICSNIANITILKNEISFE